MKAHKDMISRSFEYRGYKGLSLGVRVGLIVALSRQGDEVVIVEFNDPTGQDYDFQVSTLNVNDIQILD